MKLFESLSIFLFIIYKVSLAKIKIEYLNTSFEKTYKDINIYISFKYF